MRNRVDFSDDAVGLEAQMHERLAARRVNRVNKRREFFYVTPAEAKTHLLELAGALLEYVEVPEAVEYRQSINEAEARDAQPVAVSETSFVSSASYRKAPA